MAADHVRQFSGELIHSDSKVWHFHLVVPEDVALYYRKQKVKRLICSIDDNVSFHCGLMAEGNYHFINVNKEIRKQTKWEVGESRPISLAADDSPYGMEVSPEFLEVLDSDTSFHELFHALTPGKQRNLIYLATNPKKSETRIKKSLIIALYLKEANGKLDFKELNAAFKQYNDDFKL